MQPVWMELVVDFFKNLWYLLQTVAVAWIMACDNAGYAISQYQIDSAPFKWASKTEDFAGYQIKFRHSFHCR